MVILGSAAHETINGPPTVQSITNPAKTVQLTGEGGRERSECTAHVAASVS